MTDSEKKNDREPTPFGREDEKQKNFGDLLKSYLLDRLFIRLPRLPGDARIIASSLADDHLDLAKAQAWGTKMPVDPRLAPVTQRVKVPLKARLDYDLLRGLAAISAPFSKRRAAVFRRSAEKRYPYRIGADGFVEQIDVPFSVVQVRAYPDAARARRILVADYRIPRPDLSAGERGTFGLIADLRAIGFEVTFVPIDMADTAPYRKALEALGVTVITCDSGYSYGRDYIRSEGAKFGTFYFIRMDVAAPLLPSAKLVAPDARTIFHAPDLFFLRESRSAELSGDPAKMAAAQGTMAREIAIMQACDHVVLVSPAEIPFLRDVIPQSRLSVFPALYSTVVANPAGYAARQHIFFLGGFKHRPNVDSVKWFVDKVWPVVHSRLPNVEFHIVGAEAPADVIALGERPGVRFVGYVSDLDTILATYRLSVAPLRYGAGIKGKLGASLGAGVPCVCTTIGAEGMGIVDGVHAAVRHDAESFAEAVAALYGDQMRWEKISQKGRQLVEGRFGDAANQSAFYRVLDDAGVLPLDMYTVWCQAAEPAPLPAPNEPVDVSIIVPVHNQWQVTRSCLNSVLRALRGSGITCEVILADDGSTDETLQAAALFPGLRVVRQDRNLGFLGNCNAAAAEARGESLLFVNNDTIVLPGWLTELVRVLRAEPSAAIVCSKLLYLDGTIQEAGGVLFTDATARSLGHGKPRHDPLFSFDREVDYPTSASILFRRSFWDSVGGFDIRYSAADCEAFDLAMAARHKGMRVICAARSAVVHFEPDTYRDSLSATPKSLALTNGPKLDKKWASQFETDFLPAGTQIEIAAANAERNAFARALARRATGNLNILYFSPFPSHPDNHGNQATIQSFGRRFQKLGHKVHFALLQSTMYTHETLAQMHAAWDSFTILANSRQLSANGQEIPYDGWYQPGLGEDIRLLCEEREIDVVFCSYIFQSKLLDFVPTHILKVIDTHDKMGDRYDMLRKNGQPLEFFSCSPEQEGAYLRRADVVVARRAEEAAYFDSVSGRKTAIVIPHVEDPHFIDRSYDRLEHVGFVASANQINIATTLDFLKALEAARGASDMSLKIHIAGQVRDMVPSLSAADRALFTRPWVTLHGFIDDIGTFYRQMDAIVSPVTMGTGINVKTVQAMAYGMPLIATAWGSKGIETGHAMHAHLDVDALIDGLFRIAKDADALNDLARISRERYARFLAQSDATIAELFRRVQVEA